MKVKTPNNTNIQSYLLPDTVYDATPCYGDCIEYVNHSLLQDGKPTTGFSSIQNSAHLNGQDWIILSNRETLAHFVRTNNIRTTLVSLYLGYSKGWLTQTMNRTDRGDISDQELQDILKKLHIDWTQDTFVNVMATKDHTAYRTKPCSHTTELHKARLQQSFWNGEFVHG